MPRYKENVNYEIAEKLAAINCTQDEIATVLGVSVTRLERDEQFRDIYQKAHTRAKESLRRLQWEKAQGQATKFLRNDDGRLVLDEKGRAVVEIPGFAPDTTMQIWLGKQYLGQTDKVDLPKGMKMQFSLDFGTDKNESADKEQ